MAMQPGSTRPHGWQGAGGNRSFHSISSHLPLRIEANSGLALRPSTRMFSAALTASLQGRGLEAVDLSQQKSLSTQDG